MFRYLVAALATIYCGLLIFGDEERRPIVSREAADDVTGLTLAAFTFPEAAASAARSDSGISEAEAVRIALKAGEEIRATRELKPLRGMISEIETEADNGSPSERQSDLMYVTGSRVNLRAGPGTGNAVVTQLAFGDPAEVLEHAAGWYRIRAAEGAVDGWIYGKFLSDAAPG